MSRFFSSITAIAMLMATPVVSQAAGFGIEATRIIYPQDAASVTVGLRNTENATPYLVQAAVSQKVDRAAAAPFNITPPLFRLEPGSVNQVRIMARDTSRLPRDRESIFYFHARAISATAASEKPESSEHTQGTTRFGVGKSIKLFYRPAGLPGSSQDAQRGLVFSRVASGIQVNNNSPYFVTVPSLSVGGKTLRMEPPMIAPFSKQVISTPTVKGEISWKTINDMGGINEFKQPLP